MICILKFYLMKIGKGLKMFTIKKKFILLICFVFFLPELFAKKSNLDTIINSISESIVFTLQKNTSIAVLDFKADSKKLGSYIKEKLISDIMEVDHNNKLIIVSRDEFDKLERESEFQYSGYVDDETAVSLCKKIGAQALVVGKIENLGNDYVLTVKLLNVETAEYLFFKTYTIANDIKFKSVQNSEEKQIETPVLKVFNNSYTYNGDVYVETTNSLLYKSIYSFEKYRNVKYNKEHEIDITEFITNLVKENPGLSEQLSFLKNGEYTIIETNSTGNKNGENFTSKSVYRYDENRIYINSDFIR